MTQHIKIKDGERLFRAIQFDRAMINDDTRTVEIAISSEAAVARYFGNEILVHTKDAINLSFLSSGRAPLLMDHNHKDQIGVVESVRLGDGKVLRGTARFGKSARAEEIFQDVKDDIRSNISVGYQIEKYERDEKTEDVRCTKWFPFEVSFVSVPADTSVGVGREIETKGDIVPTNSDEIKLAREEVAEIYDLAARYGQAAKANEFVRDGKSLSDFRAFVLANLRGSPALPASSDLSQGQSDASRFDFGRFLRAKISNDWRGSELEQDISQNLTRAQSGARGMVIPAEALATRAALATTGTAAPLVGIDHRGDLFIEALKASSVCIAAGATVLPGLQANVSIPKETVAPAASWTSELAAITEANPTLANVTLTPTMLTAHVSYSRKALLQGVPQLDQMLKASILAQFAVALDNAAIQGTGTAPVPRGIINQVGIGAVAGATGVVTWTNLVDLWNAVVGQNVTPDSSMAFLVHPTVAAIMRKTEKWSGSGQPLLGDNPAVQSDGTIIGGNVLGRPSFETTNSPATKVILGRFSDLLIGLWSNVDIVVDEVSQASTGTVRIFAYQFADVAVRNAKAFAAINGI